MTPPEGSRVARIPAGGHAHSRHAATNSRCWSRLSQPGMWTAPGAISAGGRGISAVIPPKYPRRGAWGMWPSAPACAPSSPATVGGSFIAEPDAWWTDAGVAGEIESREWHLSPRDWERTLARDARMSAYGIIVLQFPPKRLRTEPQVVAAEIRSALAAGRSRGPLDIRALPAR